MNVSAFTIQDGATVCIRIKSDATADAVADATASADATAVATATASAIRAPVHFIAAADISGSMYDNNKLLNVIKSLYFMLDFMTPSDFFSLVTFDMDARIVIRQSQMTTENKDLAKAKIQMLVPDGATNLSAAISYVHELILADQTIKQGLLLLTDGEATVGATTTSELTTIARTLSTTYPSLTFTTVGYGIDHNAELLRAMATEGGGSYNVVQSLENVATVFGDSLGGLKTCVFQQVRLSVPAHVTQLTPYAVRAGAGGRNEIFAGDLQEGNEIFILINNFVQGTDTLELRASYLATGLPFNQTVPILAAVTDEMRMAGTTAYLRSKAATFIQAVSATIRDIRTCTSAARRNLMDRGTALLQELQTVQTNEILALLITEITQCMSMFADTNATSPRNLTQNRSNMMSQHTAYLGLARGIMTQTYEDPTSRSVANHDPDFSSVFDTNTSMFSNAVQRSTSEAIRNVSLATPLLVRSSTATVAATATATTTMAAAEEFPSSIPPPPSSPRKLTRTNTGF